MKYLILILTMILVSCGKNSSGTNSQLITSAIIDGQVVNSEDEISQSIVSLVNSIGTSYCTATVISEDLLLTAAHCLSDWEKPRLFKKSSRYLKDIRDLKLWFSKYDTNKNNVQGTAIMASSFEVFTVSSQNEEYQNDIAVIKLSEKIPAPFKPVAILDGNVVLPAYSEIVASGFGLTSLRDLRMNNPDHANKLTMTFLGYSETGNLFLKQEAGKNGVFHGDSGGPGFYIDDSGMYLTGVISHQAKKEATTFTNAGKFKNFILDSAKKLNATLPVFKELN